MAHPKKDVQHEETVVHPQIDTLAEFEPAFKAIVMIVDDSLRYTFRHAGDERLALEHFLATLNRRITSGYE